MRIAFSVNGVPIRLTKERMKHIADNHSELKGSEDSILETLNNPEIVQKGDSGTLLAAKKFDITPVTNNKYLVVVYKEVNEYDGFVLTAYYTSYLKRRLLLWKN